MKISRVHCIPGSCVEVSVCHDSDLEYGDNCHVESLTATLKGVSKSRISTHNDAQHQAHESEVNFLEMAAEDEGPWCYQGGLLDDIYRASFRFRFPADPVLCEHRPLRPPFDYVKPQALPPSGKYGGGNSIEYYFETCLTAVDGTKSVERKTKKTIDFTPTREPEAMDMPRSTITKQVEFMGTAGPTGQSQIIVDLDHPTVVTPREPFTLNLILKSLPSPDIFLHSWTVQLLESTCAFVSDTLKKSWTTDHTLGSEVHTNNFDARPLINALPKTVLEDLTVPGTCAASFATPNLQHTYRLQVVVTLQSGGQSQEVRYSTEAVTMLAAELGSKGLERESDEAYDFESDGPRVLYEGRLYPPTYARLFLPV